MGDKKKSKKAKQNFRNDPFRQLKGFPVSEGEKEKSSECHSRKLPETPPAEEDVPFSEAMARLGVASLGERSSDNEDFADAETGTEEPPVDSRSPEQEDEDLFLSALKGMDTVFQDELPPPENTPAAPRRMRQVRQGRLVPEDQLDLHGRTREEALEKVRFFLEDSIYQGRRTVLVITGMGKGSVGEPVLRNEVERFLNNAGRRWVSEWGRAPRQLGGAGALVVFLRGKPQ